MRCPTRLRLAILAALLLTAGGYSVFWLYVAGQIREGVVDWARSVRADKIEASWQKIRVTGFPLAFRVDLEAAALRDAAVTPSPVLRVSALSGTARPWDFSAWQLAAPAGFEGELAGSGERAPVKLKAQESQGVVSLSPMGGWNLWLRMHDASVEAPARVRISLADAWIVLPSNPPRAATDPTMSLAIAARQVQLSAAMGPLGETIDDLDFGVTVKGAFPGGKLAEAVAAWRDAGGTIELDNLRLNWGGLGATGTGTLGLDQDMQPIGGFSGAIEGYERILTALVESGHLRATDAGLARIALTMLAKPGPDGKPQIRTAFTIKNGQMFLGPAKLGKVPHLTWQ